MTIRGMKPPPDGNPNTTGIVIACTPALKTALKVVAARNGTNMMQLVRDILGAHREVAAEMREEARRG